MKFNIHALRFLVLIIVSFSQVDAVAQVNLQVRILPPYQSKITNYASRPDLILLTLTNMQTASQEVQLKGTVTGDNGISLSLKQGYRSASPILLGPLETKMLNGNDIMELFNSNNLDYVGLTERDFINGTGLPEGNYDFCIRAFDYNSPSVPLSGEQPLGCTLLSITDLEPPTIISPFNEQEVMNPGVQTFAITWSTPPSAPPTLEYNVRLVEMIVPRNPAEAIWNTNPIFERSVHGNTILYGPSEPQLTPGRQYALAIEAKDPFGKVSIRNQGRSEVVMFIYGDDMMAKAQAVADSTSGALAAGAKPSSNNPEPGDKEFATNNITGKLLWAFRSSEVTYANSIKTSTNSGETVNMTSVVGGMNSTALALPSYVTSANLNINPKVSPLFAMIKKDPTVGTTVSSPTTTFTQASPLYIQAIAVSTSGAAKLEFEKLPSTSQPAAQTHPLSGVSVNLRISVGNSGTKRVVGRGVTDENGSFSIKITDPKFLTSRSVGKIELQVNSPDFMSFTYQIDRSLLNGNVNIEVGEHVMVAKTFRFNPTFIIESDGEDFESNLDVMLYRATTEIDAKPYLQHEGNLPVAERVTKTINGKQMVTVGKVSTSSSNKSGAQFAPIFYSGNVWVEILPALDVINKRALSLTADASVASKAEVLVIKPQYKLQVQQPSITGKVMLEAAKSTLGVEGAYVQVTYNKEDLLHKPVQQIYYSPNMQVASVQGLSGTTIPKAGTSTSANSSVLNASQTSTSTSGLAMASAFSSNAHLALPAQLGIKGQLLAATVFVDVMAKPAQTYDLSAPYTVKTDDNGEYHIGNLPLLKAGKKYIITLVQVPTAYRNMPTIPESSRYEVEVRSGEVHQKTFSIRAKSLNLAGKIIDNKGIAVPNARINFQGNSSYFETGSDGTFKTQYFAGTHILEIKKVGYLDFEKSLIVKSSTNQNLGSIGPLERKIGKVQFLVHDFDNVQTTLQDVAIHVYDTTHHTNNQGEWLYEGISGEALVTLTPSESSGYVASQHSIHVEEDGEITKVSIGLKKGVKVYGKITSGNVAVAEAAIAVEGKPYLKTKSNATGEYQLFLAPGEEIVSAGKTGYFAEKQNRELVSGQETKLDFDLKDGGGKNISTLLGFEIQLEESKDDAEVAEGAIWKGKFVNLKANPKLFDGSPISELPFEKLKVTFDANGNAIPKDNAVVTTEKSLAIKLFDYLPVILYGEEFITVKRNPDRKGSISGRLKVNGAQWQRKSLGIKYGNLGSTYITPNTSTRVVDVEVFHEDVHGNAPELTFQLSRLDNDKTAIELYGIKMELNLSESRISQLGLFVTGSLTTPKLGIIDSMKVVVKELNISKEFGVESFLIDETTLPTLRISSWSADLGTVTLNEDGFKLGGKVKVNLPKSEPVELAFQNLRLAKDALYGGVFQLPDVGLQVYNIIALKTRGTPLSFSKIGETDVYSLGGAALFKFNKLIEKELKVNSFQVQTDGKFYMQAPVNESADLGFASYSITGIEVSNPVQGSPYIGVLGEFKTDIPGLKFEASDIRFSVNSNKTVGYSMGEVKASIKVPIMSVGLGLKIIDTDQAKGFTGNGKFEVPIPSTPISADVEFSFKKFTAGGVEVGATFVAGASIPIGAVVIGELGGGFKYATNTKAFSANIKGVVSIVGLSSAVKFDDVNLGIIKDPAGLVIKGEANLVVGDLIKLAKAEVELNTPAKKFTVLIDAEMEPLKGLLKTNVNGIFAVKWDKNDTYAFLGTQLRTSVLGFASATADYAIAYNVKRPKTNSDPLISRYFQNLNETYNAPSFSGAYVFANLEAKDRFDWKFDEWWCPTVIVNAHYDVKLQGTFLANFSSNQYFLQLKGKSDFGAFAGIEFRGSNYGVGGDAKFCFDINGGYNNAWHFDGKLGGQLSLLVGNTDTQCNDFKVWGGIGVRLCANVYAHMKYDRGLMLSGGLGNFSDSNASCY